MVRHVFEWIGRWVFGTIALGSGVFSLVREGIGLYLGEHAEPRTAFERCMIVAFIVSAAVAWGQERSAVLRERRRYDARFKGLPRLEVGEVILGSSRERIDSSPGVYFLDDPSSYPKCTNIYTLSMAFINNPVACTPESVAKGVSATITFYDAANGKLERSVDGRWEKTIPQGGHMELSSEMLVHEIPINSRKVLIVAIKDESEAVCHATSVDAFHDGGFVFGKTGNASPWVIKAKAIDAVVRVRGVAVDQCWLVKLTNDGIGKGFASIRCEEKEPSFSYASERDLSRKRKRR
jgi:hypothetical protein